MLYRNEYLKAAEGRPGVTAQHYAASFSTREVVMPERFERILRELTAGAPGRYRELCDRIEQKVFVPRRAELVQLEKLRQKSMFLSALEQVIDTVNRCSADSAICDWNRDAELAAKVAELSLASDGLLQLFGGNAPALPTLGRRISEMLAAISAVRDMLATSQSGQKLGLSTEQTSDWRMSYFAFSQAREHAGAYREIAAKQNWATNEWADEAIERGFADVDKVARARTKALAGDKSTRSVTEPTKRAKLQ